MTTETKAQHTEGPWHATDCRHQKNGQIRIFGRIQHIGNVLASNTKADADAALIAAAPELLKVCLDLRDWVSQAPLDVQGALKRAIAKAEGRA